MTDRRIQLLQAAERIKAGEDRTVLISNSVSYDTAIGFLAYTQRQMLLAQAPENAQEIQKTIDKLINGALTPAEAIEDVNIFKYPFPCE